MFTSKYSIEIFTIAELLNHTDLSTQLQSEKNCKLHCKVVPLFFLSASLLFLWDALLVTDLSFCEVRKYCLFHLTCFQMKNSTDPGFATYPFQQCDGELQWKPREMCSQFRQDYKCWQKLTEWSVPFHYVLKSFQGSFKKWVGKRFLLEEILPVYSVQGFSTPLKEGK